MSAIWAKVSVRAVVTLALVAMFAGVIFTMEVDPKAALAAIAGPMGIAIGFYFKDQ